MGVFMKSCLSTNVNNGVVKYNSLHDKVNLHLMILNKIR